MTEFIRMMLKPKKSEYSMGEEEAMDKVGNSIIDFISKLPGVNAETVVTSASVYEDSYVDHSIVPVVRATRLGILTVEGMYSAKDRDLKFGVGEDWAD